MLAVAIATVSTVYLAWTAKQQGRALYPVVHDEFSYLIGAQMLARGRLWMPPHPLAHFFDSFQLIVDPVYASAYFPGTALLFALPVLAHIPIWLFAAAMAGIIVALLYLLVTRLIHGTVGLLAAGLLLSAGMFRTLSVMVMSQVPVMLFGLIALLAWFNWRQSRRSRWAMLLGIASGWALITRPIDAICFLLPIGIAALIERRHLPRLICWTAIGLAPFLLIQLSSNKGITGHFF
ncbi:MAG TPA: glycosyltransferase family 39 protein, partial [Tepidisphaeraceae bacterium]|nr:glycosyltransferase family 39 protein [Tepidisphaeraceae bacterium]